MNWIFASQTKLSREGSEGYEGPVPRIPSSASTPSRDSLLFMSLTLLVADFISFNALRDPEALVSVVSSFRRGSILVAFAGAILIFGERHWRQKLPAVLGVLTGVILTIPGRPARKTVTRC